MGLTRPRAAQIFNLDYKQAVRVITTTNIVLTGGTPAVVDGVSLGLNDRILVQGQTTASQNGIYYVSSLGAGSNGTWARTSDANPTGEIEAGMVVMVTEGATYADTQWKLTTNGPITIGVTELTFLPNYQSNAVSSGSSNVTVYANSSVVISSAGVANVVTVDGTGMIIAGNVTPTGNAVSNMGSSTNYFNRVFANSTSAVQSDLAEMYAADAAYIPGTVVEFGGNQEITQTTKTHSTAVAGVVSTAPSYLMNSTLACEHAVELALVGRVPCRVVGSIRKGDCIVSSGIPGTAQALNPELYRPGCIIGKALEDYESIDAGVIEVVVGRV